MLATAPAVAPAPQSKVVSFTKKKKEIKREGERRQCLRHRWVGIGFAVEVVVGVGSAFAFKQMNGP